MTPLFLLALSVMLQFVLLAETFRLVQGQVALSQTVKERRQFHSQIFILDYGQPQPS